MYSFILANIVLPLVLSVVYSKNTKRFQYHYDVTKGVYYLLYAITIAYDYLVNGQNRHVAGFTLIVAILEGAPLILTKIFNSKAQ